MQMALGNVNKSDDGKIFKVIVCEICKANKNRIWNISMYDTVNCTISKNDVCSLSPS